MAIPELMAARNNFALAKAAGDRQGMMTAARALRDAKVMEDNASGDFADYARPIGSGLTMGSVDEMEGFVRSVISGTKYKDERDMVRAEMDRFSGDNPKTALALEVAGGLLTGGLGASKVAGLAAAKGLGRVWAGAGVGAVEGAIAGAGGAKEISDLPTAIPVGAALGGGLGAGAGWTDNFLRTSAANQRRRAADFLMQGETAESLANKAAQQGTTLAEVSDTMRGAAGAAARSGGARRQDYLNFVDARQGRQRADVEKILQQEANVAVTRDQAKEILEAGRGIQADELYSPMHGQPAQVSQTRLDFLNIDEGIKARNDALKSLRLERENPKLSMEDVQGDFDFLHQAQQTYNDTAESLAAQGKTTLSRNVRGERAKLMEEMMDPVNNQWGDRYRLATEEYRKASEVVDALSDSSKFHRISIDELEKFTTKATESQKEAYTVGVVSDLVEKSMRGVKEANTARNIIKTDDMRKRLSVLLGNERAGRLIERLDAKLAEGATFQELFSGSPTANRQAMGEILGGSEASGLGVAQSVLSGNVGEAAQQVVGAIAPRQTTIAPALADELTGMFQLTNNQDIARSLQKLEAVRAGRGAGFALAPWAVGGAAGAYGSE